MNELIVTILVVLGVGGSSSSLSNANKSSIQRVESRVEYMRM
jgi:hypothetical protein